MVNNFMQVSFIAIVSSIFLKVLKSKLPFPLLVSHLQIKEVFLTVTFTVDALLAPHISHIKYLTNHLKPPNPSYFSFPLSSIILQDVKSQCSLSSLFEHCI